MNATNYLLQILDGLMGAALTHTVIVTLFWIASLGVSIDELFVIWLLWLPVPTVLGLLAGILTSISCRSRCRLWAGLLAAFGVLCAMANIGAYTGSLDNRTELLLFVTLSGAVIEVISWGLFVLGSKVLNRVW
jgi:hypothetical protein